MLNRGHGGYSSDMSARGRVRLYGHGGYSSDMSVRGRVCLTVLMLDTALA